MSSQSYLYNALNNSWAEQYGNSLGRNSFFKVDLYSMTGTINFSSAGSNLQSLGTSNGSYLFKYLPNITGIILDGCTALTNSYNLEGTSIFQMDFTYMLCL